MKVDNKMYKEFTDLMKLLGEPLFGNKSQIKPQLEMCLNVQGYWSGVSYKIYYEDSKFKPREKYYG